MNKNGKSSDLNANKINFLSNKGPNKEKVSLDDIKSKYIHSEISSYLEGSKFLKTLNHNKKYLKEFSESDCFFQDKYYAEFLNDILMNSNVESIFYMCYFIFQEDIKILQKRLNKLSYEKEQKFDFNDKEGIIKNKFVNCFFVLGCPNILHDIFSITFSDFRKLTKEDLIKRLEDLEQLYLFDGADQIKSSMIYAYNVLKKNQKIKTMSLKVLRKNDLIISKALF